MAEEVLIHVGIKIKFRFIEAEAALAGTDVAAGNEAGEGEAVGVLRQVGVTSLQHQRHRRIECGDAFAGLA